MKTVYKVASLVVYVFLVNTFGFLYTLLSLLGIVSVYCMSGSLIQSSRRIERDLDEAERAEELARQEQEAIDEVDAFLMDSIKKRQNRLVLIEKDKKEKDKKE